MKQVVEPKIPNDNIQNNLSIIIEKFEDSLLKDSVELLKLFGLIYNSERIGEFLETPNESSDKESYLHSVTNKLDKLINLQKTLNNNLSLFTEETNAIYFPPTKMFEHQLREAIEKNESIGIISVKLIELNYEINATLVNIKNIVNWVDCFFGSFPEETGRELERLASEYVQISIDQILGGDFKNLISIFEKNIFVNKDILNIMHDTFNNELI